MNQILFLSPTTVTESTEFVVSSCYNQECFTYDKEETMRIAAKLLREDIVTKLDDISDLSWPPTL